MQALYRKNCLQPTVSDINAACSSLFLRPPAAPPLKQRGQDRAEAEQIGDEDDRVSPPRTPPPASGSLHDRAAAKAPPAVARSTPANQAQDSFQVVPLAASDSDSDAEGEADEDAAAQVRRRRHSSHMLQSFTVPCGF